MRLGIWGHSIAIRTDEAVRREHNPELDTWPGWIEILESEGYEAVNTGVYHMSTERAAYQIPRRWEAGEIDCAVVFWAFGHYYWLPELPTRDFAYYPKRDRAQKIGTARGIRKNTDFDHVAVLGTNYELADVVNANLYYQQFHNKEILTWRHENALLRLEHQARSRGIPIVHYFHPGTRLPNWLDIISGPVDHGTVGSMQDQPNYNANFMNCDNRLNRAGNRVLADRVRKDVVNATRSWYDTGEKTRIKAYRQERHTWQVKLQHQVIRGLDFDLHETAKPLQKPRVTEAVGETQKHNKGAGVRPSNRPVLSDKELKRRSKAAKRK